MKPTTRACAIIIAVLFLITILCYQGPAPTLKAQPGPIQISNVVRPEEMPQGSEGQVSATAYNSLNATFDGFARFTDELGEIRSINPENPFESIVNFTIGPYEELNITLDYIVAANATTGFHLTTFEINFNGFSFLFDQYLLEVLPIASITAFIPGQVFQQGQVGILLATIENRGASIQSVRLELYGPNFTNSSQDVDLSPGSNTVAIAIIHNISHIYDFGMFPVNLSLFYLDELVDSEVTLVPVDMTLLNRTVAVILPVLVFLLLVLFYTYRKRRRMRSLAESD